MAAGAEVAAAATVAEAEAVAVAAEEVAVEAVSCPAFVLLVVSALTSLSHLLQTAAATVAAEAVRLPSCSHPF